MGFSVLVCQAVPVLHPTAIHAVGRVHGGIMPSCLMKQCLHSELLGPLFLLSPRSNTYAVSCSGMYALNLGICSKHGCILWNVHAPKKELWVLL